MLNRLQGGQWLLLRLVGSRGLGLVAFYWISLYVTPEELGLMGLAWIVVAVCEAFAPMGLFLGFALEEEIDRSSRDTYFWSMLGSHLLCAFLALAFSPVLSMVFGEGVGPVLAVLCVLFPISAFGSLPSAVLGRELRHKEIAVRDFVSTLLGGAVGIWCAYQGAGVWSLVVRHVVARLVSTVLLCLYFPYWPGLRYDLAKAKRWVGLGMPAVLSNNVGWLVILQVQQGVVGGVLGPSALGVLNYGKKPFEVLGQMGAAVKESLFVPLFARNAREGRSLRTLGGLFGLACFVVGALVIVATEVIFGERLLFSSFLDDTWGEAFLIMPILAISFAVGFMRQWLSGILIAKKQTKLLLYSSLVEVVFYPILLSFVVDNGLMWVAWASAATSVCSFVFLGVGLCRLVLERQGVLVAWRLFAQKEGGVR